MTLADEDADSTVVDANASVEVDVSDIAHICHDRHDWRWCTLFSSSRCTFMQREHDILATFGPFGIFYTFFGFLLQA